MCCICCDLLLCDCVWVRAYVSGVVDVVGCDLFLESRCICVCWVLCFLSDL